MPLKRPLDTPYGEGFARRLLRDNQRSHIARCIGRVSGMRVIVYVGGARVGACSVRVILVACACVLACLRVCEREG
jgi:hypothetical protein